MASQTVIGGKKMESQPYIKMRGVQAAALRIARTAPGQLMSFIWHTGQVSYTI
jgi:hypothetical protein